MFEVTYNPVAGTATWVDRSHDLGDLPINDVVLDSVTGDVYASSDFGVYQSPVRRVELDVGGAGHAERRGRRPHDRHGRPGALRRDHGLSAWKLNLG